MDITIYLLSSLSLLALLFSFLAVIERNLTKAVIYSAAQSTMFAVIFYLLRAIDIVLVYVPISMALYPAALLLLIKRTEGEEI